MNLNPYASADNTQRRLAEAERKLAAFRPPVYTTVGAPDAARAGAGAMIYVSDGAAGLPILAFSDGTNWLRCDTRAVIS